MARQRTREPEEKKRRIIEAATELFVDKGYFPTTLAQIAQKARCSKSMITQHFGSKSELAETLLQTYLLELADRLKQVSDAYDSAKEKMRAEMRTYLTWCVENPNKARYLYVLRHSEFLDTSGPHPEPVIELIKGQLKSAQQHGEVLRFDTAVTPNIPTVSGWGMIVMTLGVLAAGTAGLRRDRLRRA